MTLLELADLLKQVFLSPAVIGVTVVIILYINIVNYIVRYRKKPPAPKKPHVARVKPVKPAPAEAEADEDDEDAVPNPRKKSGKR